MDDQNIRRLLHYSATERRDTDADRRLTALRHFAILTPPPAEEEKHAVDVSLRLLGTRALWISSFNEIPTRLGTIYGARWQRVYGP
jgi:hypothetical protein